METLKSRVAELVLKNSEHQAETEYNSEKSKKKKADHLDDRHSSDNSLISSWMMSSDSDDSIDIDHL